MLFYQANKQVVLISNQRVGRRIWTLKNDLLGYYFLKRTDYILL